MVLALFIASIILLAVYLSFSLYLYKLDKKESFHMRNQFPFEIYSAKNKPFGLLTYILLAAFLCFFANFIINAVKDFSITNILLVFFSLIISVIVGLLFYVPLKKEKLHLTLVIVLCVSCLMINTLLLFPEARFRQIYEQNLFYIPFAVNVALAAIYLVFMLLRSLFNLKMEVKDGVEVRPRAITLAIYEWVLICSISLTQLSLVFIDILI